ncbi:NAD(P)-binding protein [Phytomonospora sp. NPDC050363]|uniref:NAD(P)-binding protein n=1 Tax=Phytomonospora sp. NPDC050363 TaxID=3155642 RepID=UPI0033E361FE
MYEVIVIGAGLAGIGMAIALKRAGRHDFALLERADDIGGAWRGSLRHCAEEFGVTPHIRCGADVRSAVYDEAGAAWTVGTADGARHRARAVVMAVGTLCDPARPADFGPESFAGAALRSGRRDRSVDPAGGRTRVTGVLGDREFARGTVVGRGGRRLEDAWGEGAEALLGVSVSGFPNLFWLAGPDIAGARDSAVPVERRIGYVRQALDVLDTAASIEARADAPRMFGDGWRTLLRRAVWSIGGCESWYLEERRRIRLRMSGSTWWQRERKRELRREDFHIRPRA